MRHDERDQRQAALLRLESLRLRLAPSAVAALMLVARPLAAQQTPPADSASRPLIRAVQVEPLPIFDQQQTQFWGYALLNRLHIVTHAGVIRDELLFAPGQRFDSARVAETERNLRSLGLFHEVSIDTVMTDTGVTVRVRTRDGWSTFPTISLKTVGKQVIFGAGIYETNLFGTSAKAQLAYTRDPERSRFIVAYLRPRLIAHAIGIGGDFEHYSDGDLAAAQLQYPFYTIASARGGALTAEWLDARVLRFAAGNPTPAQIWRRRFSILAGDWGYAIHPADDRYLHVGLEAQLRRDDFRLDADTAPFTPTPFTRTLSGAAGPYAELRRPRYIVVHGYEGIGRPEDVDLGFRVRAAALATPRSWGYVRAGAGAALSSSVGVRVPGGFVLLDGESTGRFTSGGLDSGSVTLSSTVALQSDPEHLFVANLSGGVMKNPFPGEEFDLGLGYGARAFPQHAFTGDRQYIASAEYRWVVWPQVLDVIGLGFAGFVDRAGAWFQGSPHRGGTDAGIGFRFASIRTANAPMGRIDLAYRFGNDALRGGWVLVVGERFAFQRPAVR